MLLWGFKKMLQFKSYTAYKIILRDDVYEDQSPLYTFWTQRAPVLLLIASS